MAFDGGAELLVAGKPSQLADVPFQAMTSTFASARRAAAARIFSRANWSSASGESAIWVTGKRAKWAVVSLASATIAKVIGSSTVFEDGVIIPRRGMKILGGDEIGFSIGAWFGSRSGSGGAVATAAAG